MLNCWKWKKERCCDCKGMRTSGEHMHPLCDVRAGHRVKVASIAGGRRLCARMAAMGIYPGVEMELVCAGCGSPCLVRVNGGTLSLGAGVSEKIMVTPTA